MSELIVSRESEFKIDPEFKNLIPPLTAEEYAGLEESILQDGCRDALIVWNHTLIDGHNRYEICTRHGLPYDTVEMFFEDRDAAMLWMIQNQQARRNLSTVDSILLAQKKTAILAVKGREKQAQAGGDRKSAAYQKNAFVQMDKSDLRIDVRKETAKEAGVSTGTLARFEQVQKKAPEMIDAIRSGDISIYEAYKNIKREEKRQEMEQAQASIAAQVSSSPDAPMIHVGSSIGYVPEEKYDLLLTDPPYSTDVDNITAFAASWLPNALSHVMSTGFAYVFIGAYPQELRAYLNIVPPKHLELTQVLVWSYRNTLGITPKDRYDQSYQVCLFYRGVNAPDLDCPLTSEKWAVMEINAPGGITEASTGDHRYHSWQKPMEIAERFIRHSTKPGMTVFDPFACTGTFLLAAAKLGRKAYGFEINPDNAALAVKRGCVYGQQG